MQRPALTKDKLRKYLKTSNNFIRNSEYACPIAAFLASQFSEESDLVRIAVGLETYEINNGEIQFYDLPEWATTFIAAVDESEGDINNQQCLTILDRI